MRIVSLLGSATEIVYALGLEDRLVGISHECDYPPQALDLPRLSRPRFDPRGLTSGEIDAAVRRCMAEFGSVYEVDRALLRELRPTHVLTQAVCEVCAVPTGSVEEAVAELQEHAAVVSLDAHTVEGIFRTIEAVADAAGEPERGERVVGGLRERLAAVAGRATGPRPRVLLLEWLEPPFVPGHWVPEMVERAGGENLLGTPGHRSVEIEWTALEGLDPDVLMIEPCGYGLDEAAVDADRHRQQLYDIARRAVEADRAWVLHSAWFSRSGPRVVEGIETLSGILHPAPASDPADGRRARRWR